MRAAVILACGIAAAGLGLWLAGLARWRHASGQWKARLEKQRPPARAEAQGAQAMEDLPLPVQRYLRRVFNGEAVRADVVRIRQEGTFNLSEDGERWAPFSAEQVTALRDPGFDWEARVRMAPGVAVFVRDAYEGGEGLTEARVFGLWRVAGLSGGGAIAEGQLLRFLAETPWYPMALLPGGLVEWSEVDDRSARATLRHGGLRVSMVFTFAEDDSVGGGARTDERGAARAGALAGAVLELCLPQRRAGSAGRGGVVDSALGTAAILAGADPGDPVRGAAVSPG